MWQQLKTLNLFRSSDTANNPYQLQNERISTRIYLVTLILTLSIVTIYTAQMKITHTVQIKSLAFDQYMILSQEYPETLHCKCKYIAISYRSFLDIQTEFHQVCKSDFVRQDWIDYLASLNTVVSSDFNYLGVFLFRLLASLCRSTYLTVTNALDKFLTNQLISEEMLRQNIFEQQMQAKLDNFRLSSELSYSQIIWSLANATKINQIISSTMSDIVFTVDIQTKVILYSYHLYNNRTCTCDVDRSCFDPLVLVDYRSSLNSSFNTFIIPGLFQGCSINEAARRSSLQCFYDVSCINTIEAYLQTRTIFNHSLQPLNASAHHRFHPSSTIDEILHSLMIEQWINITSYQQYFQECQIESCTYTYTSRLNLAFIISTLVGLIGGLIKVFRLTIPRLVKWIRRKLVPPPTLPSPTDLSIQALLNRLRQLNFFSKRTATVNADDERKQILATRLFLFLLIISLIILLVYYRAIRVNASHEVLSPSYEKYLELQHDQGTNPSFSCPCSSVSIPYNQIFRVNYTLHPLCIDQSIMKIIMNFTRRVSYNRDFRILFPTYFLSLSQLCKLASHYIKTKVSEFNASVIIMDHMISEKIFNDQIQAIVQEFISLTSYSFANSLFLISALTRFNELVSNKGTSLSMYPVGSDRNYTLKYFSQTHFIRYNGQINPCECFINGQCFGPVSIYLTSSIYTDVVEVPGLFTGCSILEGLFASSWTCLFNQTCLDTIAFHLNISRLLPTDTTGFRRSTPNSTNLELIYNLFVESWNIEASHRQLFDQCQPEHCSYVLLQNNSWIVIFTTVISILGGLIKIIQLITLPFVRTLFALYAYFKRCQHPQRNNRNRLSINQLIDRLRNLNLFPSTDPQLDTEDDQRNQLIATRIFILLSIIITIILGIYSSQISVTHEVSIPHPSIDKYLSLYEIHAQVLTCPCNRIVIERSSFITIEPAFHQVCQSNFTHVLWSYGIAVSSVNLMIQLSPFLNFIDPSVIPATDFRSLAAPFFRDLRSLCVISSLNLRDNIGNFGRISFPTTELLSQQILRKQGQALIDLLHSTSLNEFNHIIRINQDWIESNDLISGIQPVSTWNLYMINTSVAQVSVSRKQFNTTNSSCSCFENRYCIEQVTFYNSSDIVRRYPNPKLYYGCLIFDALLQSDLAFLYDQNWIDEIRQLIDFDWNYRLSLSTPALNASLPSRYNPSTLLSEIVQNMMTEAWYTNVNYSAYFDECQPIECRYKYEVKYDVIYTITTVIGLIGGVFTILQLIIPAVTKRTFKQKPFSTPHKLLEQMVKINNMNSNSNFDCINRKINEIENSIGRITKKIQQAQKFTDDQFKTISSLYCPRKKKNNSRCTCILL